MTKKEILQTAKAQLAVDLNCPLKEWNKEVTVVRTGIQEGRRAYPPAPDFFRMVCFGGQTLISADSEIFLWCKENLEMEESAWILQYPVMEKIGKELHLSGQSIADGHLFYLPDPKFHDPELELPVKWYEGEELEQFRGDERFQKALGFIPGWQDVLAAAAWKDGNIVGMAGASRDSDSMWQIGIDVIPECRGNRIAAGLTALLKREIMKRGIVPFYGTAYSHLISQNVAYGAGFFPAWAEVYSQPIHKISY